MPSKINLILSAPPADVRAASHFGLPVAHMAYRIGNGPHLFRANLPISARGGLMVIDSVGFDGRGDAAAFCQEVLRECTARGFDGIVCDFEARPTPALGTIIRTLGEQAARRGWPLYIPEAYAEYSGKARILISSALSGGSLRQRLLDAAEQHGVQRLALGLERVAEDFFLPSPTGQGTPLTREELRQRMEEQAPSVFFSAELCSHYFTYMSRRSGAHFILFDDAGSIRKKLQIAHSLGIRYALAAYPQVDDLLPELLRRPPEA